MYSTLALGKEREIVKEETALRKEKEAVCCYVQCHVDVHIHVQAVQGCVYIYRQPRRLRKPHTHTHTHIGSHDGLENYRQTLNYKSI